MWFQISSHCSSILKTSFFRIAWACTVTAYVSARFLAPQLRSLLTPDKFGLDYDETFSPQVTFESLHTMIVLAVQSGFTLHHADGCDIRFP